MEKGESLTTDEKSVCQLLHQTQQKQTILKNLTKKTKYQMQKLRRDPKRCLAFSSGN